MGNKIFFLGLSLACLLILACESKEKYLELEATLSDTQARLEQKSQQAQELESKLRESEENRNKAQQDTADLQARFADLEKTRQQLSQTLKETRRELEEKNATAQQKEEMIQALDDAKRQLETDLQSQIEVREKKIGELKAAVSELDTSKRHFETDLTDLKAQHAAQEQKTAAQEQKIAAQEKKIIEQRNIIAELDATKLTFEDTLQLRQAQLERRGEKIKELKTAIAQLDKTKYQIETNLQKQIKAQQVKLEEMEGQLRVTFIDKILFSSGSVWINQEGQDLLSTLADSFKQNKNHNITVEGHTDNVLINPEFRSKFPTNWELSAARSAAVVRYLQDKAGVDPERLAACGYSFYKPVASNLTEVGQQQNRRIEIILTPPR